MNSGVATICLSRTSDNSKCFLHSLVTRDIEVGMYCETACHEVVDMADPRLAFKFT